jgi:hypothetical protein
MTNLTVIAVVRTAAVMAVVAFAACGSETTDPSPGTARAMMGATAPRAGEPAPAVVEDCSTRSEASFPAAFTDSRDVVVGPLVLVGAGYTSPGTVREFGGNKFPALVRAGHRVTVALARHARGIASLGYGPLPEAVELSPSDGHPVVTFIACAPGEPSGSTAGGRPVTFWSGFVLTRTPGCVPLEVWVDDERSPRRTALRMGVRRCP